MRRNLVCKVRFVDGDDKEVLPGIRACTGARHTYGSQYTRLDGQPPFVLASDNCHLYENLKSHRAGATFDPADAAGNIAARDRMIRLAGSPDRVIPGHDPVQFNRYPTIGRIVRVR